MNILKVIGILLLELIVQSTVFQFFNIGGVYPDLVLITVICFSILLGKNYSYIIGFSIGLIIDLFYRTCIGINGLSFMLTALVISLLSENMFKESLFVPISLFPIGLVVNHGVYYMITYLLGINDPIAEYSKGFNLTYWLISLLTIICVYPIALSFANKYIIKSSSRS